MTEKELLQLLLNAYIELLHMNTTPGDKSHMLAYHTAFIQRKIREICKRERS